MNKKKYRVSMPMKKAKALPGEAISKKVVEGELVGKLADKSMTTKELLQFVEQDCGLLPQVVRGVSSSTASVRYGCAKVLMELSEAHPEKLYRYFESFTSLLDSKFRIIIWSAMAIIANLTKVDKKRKFDAIFDKYYGFIDDEYMVTVANVVGHSGEIALAKPYLINRIADELLKVESVSLTPHLTEECRRVIIEKAIHSFDLLFDRVKQKRRIISFVEKYASSPRKTLRAATEDFLKKWG